MDTALLASILSVLAAVVSIIASVISVRAAKSSSNIQQGKNSTGQSISGDNNTQVGGNFDGKG